MDKQEEFKKVFLKKEMHDYYYIISFLLIFSFFIFYIIKPSLTTAFSLKTELDELETIYSAYNKNIIEVRKISLFLQNSVEEIDLVDKAIPQMPETKTLIEDIKNAATNNEVSLNNLSLSSFDLKNSSKSNQFKNLVLTMDTSGKYTNIINFTQQLFRQKRLKTIQNFKIGKKEDELVISSDEGQLKVSIQLAGYYL
jgi:Tfp pilus assembly protein PilO